MKRLKETIIMMLAVCLFAACDSENSDDVIWDITPISFFIFITDSEGHDLLDSTFQNNLIKEITVSYQGKTYPVVTEYEYYERLYGKAQTRFYMPNFYGLVLRNYWEDHKNYELVFGEFDGMENIDKREITLNLPDDHQAVLSYKNSFEWKSNGEPNKNTVFYLDGQELKSSTYNFQYSDNEGLKYIPSKPILYEMHPSRQNIWLTRRIPATRASISSFVLYRAKEARTVPEMPRRSIKGWAQ